MNMDAELFLKLAQIRQVIDEFNEHAVFISRAIGEFNEMVKQKSTLNEPSGQDVVSTDVTSTVIEESRERKPRGRPKKYTEEELKERHRQQAIEYSHRTESKYKCYGGKPVMSVEERMLKKKEHNQKYYAKIRANREKIQTTGLETLQSN